MTHLILAVVEGGRGEGERGAEDTSWTQINKTSSPTFIFVNILRFCHSEGCVNRPCCWAHCLRKLESSSLHSVILDTSRMRWSASWSRSRTSQHWICQLLLSLVCCHGILQEANGETVTRGVRERWRGQRGGGEENWGNERKRGRRDGRGKGKDRDILFNTLWSWSQSLK